MSDQQGPGSGELYVVIGETHVARRVCAALVQRGCEVLHLIAPGDEGLRKNFAGVLVANDGFGAITTRESAQALLDDDLADAVAVGRLYLANPDLPARWQSGADLNEPNPDTFYGGAAAGYTHSPSLPG